MLNRRTSVLSASVLLVALALTACRSEKTFEVIPKCENAQIGTSCAGWGTCALCNQARCERGIWTPDAQSSCGKVKTAK